MVIFQVVLITLVRCAFLRDYTVRFCTIRLRTDAYCDYAILHSMRNLEQNVAGFGRFARVASKLTFVILADGELAGDFTPQSLDEI